MTTNQLRPAAHAVSADRHSRIAAAIRDFLRKLLNGSGPEARFARGTFWSLSGAGISQGCNLAASILAARLLGNVGFGELGVIQSTVGMFGVLAGFGLSLTSTRYLAELRSIDPLRAGRVLGLSSAAAAVAGSAMAACIFLFAPLLATNALSAPQLTGALRIGTVLLFANAVNGAQTGSLLGFEAFRVIACLNALRGVLTLFLVAAGTIYGGLPGAITAFGVAALAGCLLNTIAIRRECRAFGITIQLRGALREAHILWSFSVPALLSGAMAAPATWVTQALLARCPHGYSELGFFNAASQWRTALLFLPGLIGQVSLPMLSNLWGTNDYTKARRLLVSLIGVSAALTLPLLAPIVLLNRPIMSLYGRQFAPHGDVLIYSAIAGGLLALQSPVATLVAASARMWAGTIMNAGWAAVLIVSTWLLLSAGWGAAGLALAHLLAYAVHATWTFAFAASTLRRAMAKQ